MTRPHAAESDRDPPVERPPLLPSADWTATLLALALAALAWAGLLPSVPW